MGHRHALQGKGAGLALVGIQARNDDQPHAPEGRKRPQPADHGGAVDAWQKNIDQQLIGLQMPGHGQAGYAVVGQLRIGLRKVLLHQQLHQRLGMA